MLVAEDIADQKHPLRFHQFVTNMKRSTPSPLLPGPQDSPEPVSSPEAGTHAALSSQQAQPAQPSTVRTPTGQMPIDQIPTDQTSSSTNQDTETRTDSESGTGQSFYRELADLLPPDEMSRTLSRGGPVPGTQVRTSPTSKHCPDACLSKSLLWDITVLRRTLCVAVAQLSD